VAGVDGRLSRIGRARLVVSKRPRGPWRKTVAIVTHDLKLDPRRIVAIYEKRWGIEVMFKELRQDLGLGDYQMLAEDGSRAGAMEIADRHRLPVTRLHPLSDPSQADWCEPSLASAWHDATSRWYPPLGEGQAGTFPHGHKLCI
jgi:hypothetical protein